MFSVELYGRVRHACHVEGLSIREAARRFGIHRNTVRKMLAFSVPPGYRRRLRTQRYSVLYLNDGLNLFDPTRAFAGATWQAGETAADLVRRRRITPLLIVGIDHGDERRSREYLPVEDTRNPAARRRSRSDWNSVQGADPGTVSRGRS